MQDFSTSPKEIIASFWRNRSLIKSLVQREIIGRYRGSVFGILWSLFNPILMLTVYTFVFSIVFRAKWSTGSDSKIEFALVLFAGLIIFNLFAESISRSSSLILNNVNYVKKVVFPLEILPWINLGAATFHFAISLGVWLLTYFLFYGLPYLTVFLLPLIIIPFLLLILGLTYFLSALGVYLRDILQLIGLIITIMLFMSPIFYPISSLPVEFHGVFMLNPLTPIIEMTRNILYFGHAPKYDLLMMYYFFSILVLWIGFVWFQKTRKGFSDVL